MRTKDAREYFDGAEGVARVLGISGSAVRQWVDVVPYYSAVQLMKATHGGLTVDESDYDTKGRAKRQVAA